jgi:hypothetical protein
MKNERKSCITCKHYRMIKLHGVLQSEICTHGADADDIQDGDYSECVSCKSARMLPFLCGSEARYYEKEEDD